MKHGSSARQLTLYLGKRDYVDHVSEVDKVGMFFLRICVSPRCECKKFDSVNLMFALSSLQMAL